MAVSVVVNKQTVWGDTQVRVATVTFDASYPTGGEAVTAADFNMSEITWLIPSSLGIADEALSHAVWDNTNSKIIVIAAAGTQEGSTTDLSATTLDVLVIGK